MIEKELKSKEAMELFKAISMLQTPKECQKFFRDLCTLSELQAMIERYQVAKLVSNKESYRSISSKTGSSTATITRVAHWLHHGTGGYSLLLERMKSN